MAGSTTNYGATKPAVGEAYDVNIGNNNSDIWDTEIRNSRRVKNARFNMIAAKSGAPAGNGITLGPLQSDPTKTLWQKNNDFCVADNTPDNTAGSTGRIRILKAGIYNLSAGYLPGSNPGNINWALLAGGDKITMNRTGTYGDWEAVVSSTGIYLAVGAFIEGYQANSNGVIFACWINVTYLGDG